MLFLKCAKHNILTKSSTISLVADTARMNNSGTSVVYRPVGDTSGICCHTTHQNIREKSKTNKKQKKGQIKGGDVKKIKHGKEQNTRKQKKKNNNK